MLAAKLHHSSHTHARTHEPRACSSAARTCVFATRCLSSASSSGAARRCAKRACACGAALRTARINALARQMRMGGVASLGPSHSGCLRDLPPPLQHRHALFHLHSRSALLCKLHAGYMTRGSSSGVLSLRTALYHPYMTTQHVKSCHAQGPVLVCNFYMCSCLQAARKCCLCRPYPNQISDISQAQGSPAGHYSLHQLI